MPMIDHDIKCHPASFDSIAKGAKPFTVRKDDRDYGHDDLLLLREWHPDGRGYTGAAILARVSYIHQGLGMQTGYVVLGLRDISLAKAPHAAEPSITKEKS